MTRKKYIFSLIVLVVLSFGAWLYYRWLLGLMG